MQKRHPKLAEWVKKYEARAKKEPTLGASWGYASTYIIAEAIKRAKSADTDKVIAVLERGLRDGLPVGQGHHARLRHAGASRPSGSATLKIGAQGKPVLADIEETHGKDLVESCDEVAKLRAAAAEKKK